MAPFVASIEYGNRLMVKIQPKEGNDRFIRDFYRSLGPGGVVREFGIVDDQLVVVMFDGKVHAAPLNAQPDDIASAYEFIENGRFSISQMTKSGFFLEESEVSILKDAIL